MHNDHGYAKGRARRQEILDQAMALFGTAGYRGTSLREIAARCGLSHPGLLHHFPTKQSLLLAVLEHRDEVDAARLAGRTGLAVLRGLIDIAALNATRPGIVELFTVLSAEATAPEHPAHEYFVRRYQRTVHNIGKAYERVREEGMLRAGIEPGAAARQLVALMDGLQIQWLLSRLGAPREAPPREKERPDAGGRLDMAAVLRAHLQAQLTVPLPVS